MEPDTGESGVVAAIEESLQKALSEHAGDIGANLLGDWMVIAEVHTADGAVLRLINAETTPLWRQLGLLKFASSDLEDDMLVYRILQNREDK